MSCGAEIEANRLFEALTAGLNIVIPLPDFSGDEWKLPIDLTSDLYKNVVRLKNEDLTSGEVNGTGTFDIVMKSLRAHLREEYDQQRITGAEYTKAYTAMVESALGNSVQFLLGRDQAFWAAVNGQSAAMIARVQLETAKIDASRIQLEALTAQANYALTKLKLSTEEINYCSGKFSLDFLLPAQLILVTEQGEVQRAQTLNTRSDGAEVVGLLGKQRDLYEQQITSYQRDAEVKAAKLFTDAWITQKTIDEELLPPENFKNLAVDTILGVIRDKNGML